MNEIRVEPTDSRSTLARYLQKPRSPSDPPLKNQYRVTTCPASRH